MNGYEDSPQPVSGERKKLSRDCGLVGMEKLGQDTRKQLERLFNEPQFDGYVPTFVSFSDQQMDHVALELAYYRLRSTDYSPKISHQITVSAAAEIPGVLLVGLPTRDDSNKTIGTVILINKDLAPEDVITYRSSIANASEKVRKQLT